MKTFKQFLLEAKLLKESPSLEQYETGLDTEMYISKKPDEKHKEIRLKFTEPDTKQLIPIGIKDDDIIIKKSNLNNKEKLQKLIKRIREWIKLNLEIITRFWNDKEYNIDQFIKDMQKLK